MKTNPSAYRSLEEGQSEAPPAAEQTVRLPVYQGPFNVNCTSNRDPWSLMADIQKALDVSQVAFEQTGPFALKCSRDNLLSFSIELHHLEDLTEILFVKFRRLTGETQTYREVSSRVLARVKLV